MFALVRNCIILEQVSPLRKSHGPLSLSLSFRNCSIFARKEVVDVAAVRDLLVKKHRFAPELASNVASQLDLFRSSERADSILSFLKENSFTNIQLQTIVKHSPRILTASFEDDLKFKIKILKDFGFSLKDIAKLLTAHRALLNSSAEKKIVPQLAALKSLIGLNDEVVKLVKGCGLFMYIDLEKTLVPNLQLLRSSGVDEEGIRNLMCNKPRCLLVNPDAMRRSVEKVNEIGVDSGSKGFVYAIGAVASMKEETWEFKLQGFKDMGFSGSQVLMFKAAPTLPSTSLAKIKAIKELLIATGRFDLSDIVKDPCSLMCSIELKYKPRFQILEILDSKKVIRRWPCLKTIRRMPHDEFFEKFVRPYSEHLGEVSLPEGCLKKGKEKGKK